MTLATIHKPDTHVSAQKEEGPMEPMGDGHEPEVYWLVPRAWEDELAVEIVRALTLSQWLATIGEWAMTVVTLPYARRVVGGPADGGRVVAVDAENGRHYFALPPEALPALRGLIPTDAYARLIDRGLDREGEAGDGDA